MKSRDHRARRTQHVAEAHRHEARRVARVEVLHHQFRHPLGRPHHRGRAHRLVGRDLDEGLDPGLPRHLAQAPGREDVVLHRLGRVRLHHRHVLVGRRSAPPPTVCTAPSDRASARDRRRRPPAARSPARGNAARSSRSISKSTNSARSTSSSVPTPKRATCRASSAPIEPPAPVTITVLPARNRSSSPPRQGSPDRAPEGPRSPRRGCG